MGFGRASAGQGQSTPRNLHGLQGRHPQHQGADADFDEFVWLRDDVDWMNGGTYQVARKIR